MSRIFRDLGPADEGSVPPKFSGRSSGRGDVIHGDVIQGDVYHGDRVHGNKIVNAAPPRPAPPRTILVMSANPVAQQLLRLDEERRAIDRAVRPAGGRLQVRTADALRLDDLQTELLRHRPLIAHFSGHGSASGHLFTVDDHGNTWPVDPGGLVDLFRILNRHVRCVVLNACYTDRQAEAIVAHVPCVVGMHREVSDRTAIRFAAGFYAGIAHNLTVREAFDLGRNTLRLHQDPGLGRPRLLDAGGAADHPLMP